MTKPKPPAPTISAVDWGISTIAADDPNPDTIAALEHDELRKLNELTGARFAWSRRADCPCLNLNQETDQADPRCPKCKGSGFFYFGPRNYVVPTGVGPALDTVQENILAAHGGALIRGVIDSGKSDQNPFRLLGNWLVGDIMISVQPENVLGQYDRLVNIDEVIVYNEVFEQPSGTTVSVRYPIVSVNNLATVDTTYVLDDDFEVNNDGTIKWLHGVEPAVGTRVSINYLMHPTWLIMATPHAVRSTPRRGETFESYGTPETLSIQAHARLEQVADSQAGA